MCFAIPLQHACAACAPLAPNQSSPDLVVNLLRAVCTDSLVSPAALVAHLLVWQFYVMRCYIVICVVGLSFFVLCGSYKYLRRYSVSAHSYRWLCNARFKAVSLCVPAYLPTPTIQCLSTAYLFYLLACWFVYSLSLIVQIHI